MAPSAVPAPSLKKVLEDPLFNLENKTTFAVLDDPRPDDKSLPAFMVSTTRGFLPRQEPIVVLPQEFAALEDILQSMPITKANGEPGLLAHGKLGETVERTFPNLVAEVDQFKDDMPLLNALYRDYSFLASAYLLEPCHLKSEETGGKEYGLGRGMLPRSIAQPIAKVAKLTGFQPFMEYAGSYALFNYKLLNPSAGITYDNLALIRAFEHGLDRTSSEAGFVLVHVDMVKHSGGIVKGACEVLKALDDLSGDNKREAFDQGLQTVYHTMKDVNATMDTMWQKSKPGAYTSFRTFIMGITSQSMFPNGVIYEGVSDEPLSFRGESGANDSMIPLVDNLCQIPMPENPLTTILKDFRKYRPGNHREFLEFVARKAKGNVNEQGENIAPGVVEYARSARSSTILYLLILDQVREFRWRHWCFTREYIIKKTRHPTATGGSPIVTWLPNQLGAVLDLMDSTLRHLDTLKPPSEGVQDKNQEEVERVRDVVERQKTTLEKEVKKYVNEEERGEDMASKA